MGTSTYDGDWQYLGSVLSRLYGGPAGKVFSAGDPTYLKNDGTSFSHEIETFEFDFEELDRVKEVDQLKLLFSVATGATFANSDLAIYIGHRNHRAESVTWTSATELVDMFDSDTAFFFRSKGVGKLIRFKFTWTNKATYAITELVKMSLFKLSIDGNTNPEK
jgi:hypothetical protein